MIDDVFSLVDQLGKAGTVQGLLAIVGVATLFRWLVGLYRPKDNFRFLFKKFNKLSLDDEREFFAEKAEFERVKAIGNADLGFVGANHIFTVFSATILIASFILMSKTIIFGTTLFYVGYAIWFLALITAWRHKAYLSRRARRYAAFIGGDLYWASSYQGKNREGIMP